MSERNESEQPSAQVKKRVEDLKGFYSHLTVYAVMNIGLFLVNLATDRGNWWFYWPLLGWGTAVLIHAAVTFGVEGPFGKRWEERKLHELMDQERMNRSA